MYLFFSDLHLGRQNGAQEREIERRFIDCVGWHLTEYGSQVKGLFLVGDVFDEYIAYRHTVPKGFVRLKGALARWSDDGLSVTYLLGNHDPWHDDYFEREMGVSLHGNPVARVLDGTPAIIAHGDSLDPSSSLYRLMRPLLRHPVPVEMYKYLFPGDTGLGLAKWVNGRARGESIEQDRTEGLRFAARYLLERTSAELIVFGHSHFAELRSFDSGKYLNPGCWRMDFTFGLVENGHAALMQWNGQQPENIERSTPGSNLVTGN